MRGLDAGGGRLKPWLPFFTRRTSWLATARRTYGQSKKPLGTGNVGGVLASMPGSRSEVSDGLPFFSVPSMATNSSNMLSHEPAAREQRVTAENSNGKHRPRSRHRNVRDGSGSAPSNDDCCESPDVDKTKKAGEGSSNARTIVDSHTPQVEIERKKVKKDKKKSKKAGEGSSNARAVTDSHKNKNKPTVDGKKAREGSSNARAVDDGRRRDDRHRQNLEQDPDDEVMSEVMT